MSGPFPGMDPWLETPALWPGLHASLIIYIRDELQPLLRPNYIATVEERVYVTGICREIIPDVAVRLRPPAPDRASTGILEAKTAGSEVDEAIVLEASEHEFHEPFIQILDRSRQTEVVTVLEILSPTNKFKGLGRKQYLAKQRQVLHSTANLVEVDLLRAGKLTLGVRPSQIAELGAYDYIVAMTRGHDRRTRSFFYPRFVRERLPRIKVPLRPADPAIPLDLQALFDRAYEAGDYASSLNYSIPCNPRLRPDDEAWASERIRAWQAAAHA